MHSALFARTLRGLGLNDSHAGYVDAVPAVTLASPNMTSSQPNRLYGNGFRRHGFNQNITWCFDEHVEADSVHEKTAGRDLAGGLDEEQLTGGFPTISFGQYVTSASFGVDGAEKWQSEYLQLLLYILAAVWRV